MSNQTNSAQLPSQMIRECPCLPEFDVCSSISLLSSLYLGHIEIVLFFWQEGSVDP